MAFWPLDEASGQTTASDATGTGHDGTYAGAVTLGGPGAPKNGNAAATFSGGDVTVPYSADLNPVTYTVEAWVNPTSVNDGMDQGSAPRSIVCSRDDQGLHGWMLYADNYTGTPQFAFVVGADSSRRYVYDGSGTAEQAGRWYHVAGAYDGTDLHLYVNGVEVTGPQLNDGGGTNIQPNPTAPLEIASCNGGRAPWHGAIQDLTFWNGALDAATIAAHASGGTPPPGGGGGGGGAGSAIQRSTHAAPQGAGPQRPLILIPGALGSYLGMSAQTGSSGRPTLHTWSSLVDDAFLQSLAGRLGRQVGGLMPGKGAGGLVGEIKWCAPRSRSWPDSTLRSGCPVDGHHYDTTVSKLVGLGIGTTRRDTRPQTRRSSPSPTTGATACSRTPSLLRQRVKQVLALTHAQSVDILAHSQGGLIGQTSTCTRVATSTASLPSAHRTSAPQSSSVF